MVEILIHCKDIEHDAREQIKLMEKHPAFTGLIAIQPDSHYGKGCVIGFTGRFKNDLVIPNIIGVDIGCGVTLHPLGQMENINWKELDHEIRRTIPLGFNRHKDKSGYQRHKCKKLITKTNELCEKIDNKLSEYKIKMDINPISQIGTLGGGNHFIEINKDDNNNLFLIVHSGSRNLGNCVAQHYQKIAKKWKTSMKLEGIPNDMEYLCSLNGSKEYLTMMKLSQEFAKLNRRNIITNICTIMNVKYDEDLVIESVHNYIGDDGIIRKGAISAYENEKVLIPLNMRDGTIIGEGKGNKSYNYSAPHGSGRLFGRNEMKRKLNNGIITMEQFKEEMKDVNTFSVSEKTIDESPFAYKPFEMIEEYLKETVEIKNVIKPIYNLKSE